MKKMKKKLIIIIIIIIIVKKKIVLTNFEDSMGFHGAMLSMTTENLADRDSANLLISQARNKLH